MPIFPRRDVNKPPCAMWYWERVPCCWAPSSRGASPWRVCMCPQTRGGATGPDGWGLDLWPHQFPVSQASAGPQLSARFPVGIKKRRERKKRHQGCKPQNTRRTLESLEQQVSLHLEINSSRNSWLTLIVLTLLRNWSSPEKINSGGKSQGFTDLPFCRYWLRLARRSS